MIALRTTIFSGCLAAAAAAAAHGALAQSPASLADIAAQRGGWRTSGRVPALADSAGRQILQYSENAGAAMSWRPAVDFTDGDIEVDLRGRDVFQKSFVGIAFHVTADTAFDVVYLRPFNFQSTDPVRRAHAIQFASYPAQPWERLRADRPTEFEKGLPGIVDPNAWQHLRISVRGRDVSVFLNYGATPVLHVQAVGGQTHGGVGPWVGDVSPGDFANLIVRPSPASPSSAPAAAATHVRSPAVVGDLRVTEFSSKTFGNKRYLRVLLPDEYDAPENRTRQYPVLYLADGQNLFDPATSVFGPSEWQVDETVHRLVANRRIPPIIVVGVDNAGSTARAHEYLPWADTSNARRDPAYDPHPQGQRYPAFLVDEVMPFINSQFRTLRDAQHTGIGGSSYGGLISTYTFATRPGVFGRALIESPSLSVFEGQMLKDLRAVRVFPERVYVAVGTNEDGQAGCRASAPVTDPAPDVMVRGVQLMAKTLRSAGLDSTRLHVVIEPCAAHTHAAWAARLPNALEFLFADRAPALPATRTAATAALEFHAALPAKGSLTEQVAAQWRELNVKARGASVIKIRAFAVGDSALGASAAIIARLAADANVSLPVVSLVGVAGFPDSAQRIQLESTTAGAASINPNGVVFVAGIASPDGARAAAGLARVAVEAGVPTANIVRISCFYEQADQVSAARPAIAEQFPAADVTFVHSYASSARPAIECEAVGRLARRPVPDVRMFNLFSGPPSANYSHAALVSAPTLLFTGSRIALGTDSVAMQTLFRQLAKDVAQEGGRLTDVVMGENYWLTDSARDQLRAARATAFGAVVPAATGVFFSSLSDRRASVAIELVVAVGRAHVDTIALYPGSPLVDGRQFQSHVAEVTQTIQKGGATVQTNRFTLDKRVNSAPGAQTLHLALDALETSSDPAVHGDITLDLRMMAVTHREDRDTGGLRSRFTVDGPHVVGEQRAGDAVAPTPYDFTLSQPAFSSVFLDAVANATQLREGTVLRVPAFGVAPTERTLEWHHLHVIGRDTVRVSGQLFDAWVIEEQAGGAYPPRRMWITRQPPYFPLQLLFLPDGSTIRTEQQLRRAPG